MYDNPVGRSLGGPAVESRPSQIDSAHNQLANVAGRIEEQIAALSSRLIGVLRPYGPEKASNAAATPPHAVCAPLADMISIQATKLELSSQILNDLLERIEL